MVRLVERNGQDVHNAVTFNQLQKFWSELPLQARQKLVRIEKQTLFERARKKLYCSRCNGLLLEFPPHIVMYGRSLRDAGTCHEIADHQSTMKGEIHDSSHYPWGGLTTARDGSLTLLICYLRSKSYNALQNVFDSARAKERERQKLYPDACGGGGRGWISHGRGHAARETCALHTAHPSCNTLVDFWSAIGEDAQQTLLRMKEEDFIEALTNRFGKKKFCKDCRRNVTREFKELKELKGMHREPCRNGWYFVADTAFPYETSDDVVQTHCHYTEVNVKANSIRKRHCLHCRLLVKDGYVTITIGESIRGFFEHAEEVEEEEDDDSEDMDGNEMGGKSSRPQKLHAKTPELAKKFLLDAATVIFKEQVEKAFREGTARQNTHSIFVCLAFELFEEHIHVACKEIITLELQMRLLEEEENEKHQEEERKGRRRTKEQEKKLRRKERLKGKGEQKEKQLLNYSHFVEESFPCCRKLMHEKGHGTVTRSGTPDIHCEKFLNECTTSSPENLSPDGDEDRNHPFTIQLPKSSRRRLKSQKSGQLDQPLNRTNQCNLAVGDSEPRFQSECVDTPSRVMDASSRQLRNHNAKSNFEELQSSSKNLGRYGFHQSSGKKQNEYRTKLERCVHGEWITVGSQPVSKPEPVTKDVCSRRPYSWSDCFRDQCKTSVNDNYPAQNSLICKQVWEPTEPWKMNPRSKSESDFTFRSSSLNVEQIGAENTTVMSSMCGNICSHNKANVNFCGSSKKSTTVINSSNPTFIAVEGYQREHAEDRRLCSSEETCGKLSICHETTDSLDDTSNAMSISSSGNCSSCLSEPDSNIVSSGHGNSESSSTSASEDSSQSDRRNTERNLSKCWGRVMDKQEQKNAVDCTESQKPCTSQLDDCKSEVFGNLVTKATEISDTGKTRFSLGYQLRVAQMPDQHVQLPICHELTSTMGYFPQNHFTCHSAPYGAFRSLLPNHPLYCSHAGYGSHTNSKTCLEFGRKMTHVGPVFRGSPLPVNEPVPFTNGFQLAVNNQISSPAEAKGDGNEAGAWDILPVKSQSVEGAAIRNNSQSDDNSTMLHTGNNNFSLFHFGGPIALSTGCKSNVTSLEDGILEEFSSQLSIDLVDHACACTCKDTTIEEYNLFATTTGIKFSF